MTARIVEWQLPYTWWTGIGIDANKVISLLLREENNLIQVNDNNEIYTDLQLEDWMKPSDTFPVWVTVWKALASDWWWTSWILVNMQTTSWDYSRWIYGTNGKLYYDNWTWTFTQIYSSTEVDASFTALRDSLATVSFTWDYNDLINRPLVIQLQSDWNQTDTSSPDYIKNKPTIWDGTLTITRNNVSMWTFKANQTTNSSVNIDVPTVVDNLTSTSTTSALSANQGKVLDDKISQLSWLGRFLSLWDSATGLPISFPLTTPYTYNTGDWFMVEITGTTNYMPNGATYTWTASTTVDTTNNVEQRDVYIYDWNIWLFQKNNETQVSFSDIAWQPTDNTNLATALNAKQDTLSTQTVYTSQWDATHVPQITTNSLWQVTWITEVAITQPTVNNWTLTLVQNSSTKWTFTANQNNNSTVDLETSIPVTQNWYDALPSTKTSDGNLYIIYW